jgi:hypothetical protein
VQHVSVHVDVHPHAAARFPLVAREVALVRVRDGQPAQHHIAVSLAPEQSHRVHHPAHAEQSAERRGLAVFLGPATDHLLQSDHIGVEARQDLGDAVHAGAAIHAAALVDVVGGQAEMPGGADARMAGLCHDPRSRGTSSLRQPAARKGS